MKPSEPTSITGKIEVRVVRGHDFTETLDTQLAHLREQMLTEYRRIVMGGSFTSPKARSE